MLLSWLHALAAQPRIYDIIQNFCGARQLRQQLASQIRSCAEDQYVIDFGGGTGAMLDFLPAACRYVCLDVDRVKLQGFRAAHREGRAVLGSASSAPFRDCCADYILVVAMCHHLDDGDLEDAFREIRRVLKPAGRLVLLDPVLAPQRMVSKVLWALDRGSHPRTASSLATMLNRHLRLAGQTRLVIYHEYLITVGVK